VIWTKFASGQFATAPVHRSSRNPSSLLELSDQLRLIWLDEITDEVRLLGAVGGGGGADGVVASTAFE
jgi:hypothetical protein